MKNPFAGWWLVWSGEEKSKHFSTLRIIVYSLNNFVNTNSLKQKELLPNMQVPHYSQDTDSTSTSTHAQWWSVIFVFVNMMLMLIMFMHMIVLFNKKIAMKMNVLNEQKRVGQAVKREEVITLMIAWGNVHSHSHSHTQINAHQLSLISVCSSFILSVFLFEFCLYCC